MQQYCSKYGKIKTELTKTAALPVLRSVPVLGGTDGTKLVLVLIPVHHVLCCSPSGIKCHTRPRNDARAWKRKRLSVSITALLDDVLVRIFSMLPCHDAIYKVCRRWDSIIHTREAEIWKMRSEAVGFLDGDTST